MDCLCTLAPPCLNVEALIPNVTAFGMGGSLGVIGPGDVMRVGPHDGINAFIFLKRRTMKLSVSPSREDTVRKQPPKARKGPAPEPKQTGTPIDFQPPEL